MSRILSSTRQMPAATPISSSSPDAPMEDGGGPPTGGLLPSDDAGWDGGESVVGWNG